MEFFWEIPDNVKILATSRITLGWPNEQLVELDGLTAHDSAQVFRQWTPQRKNDFDEINAMKLSDLVNGHPLSLRLLASMFNNVKEPIDQFIQNLDKRLPKAANTAGKRHKTVNHCIEYSFEYL